MPLPERLARLVWNYTVATMVQAEGAHSSGQLVDSAPRVVDILVRARQEFGQDTSWNDWQARGMITRARNAQLSSRAMQQSPQAVLSRAQHPIDPRIGPMQPQYSYRAVIRWQDAQGMEDSAAVTVRSSVALSQVEITERIEELIDWTDYADERRAGRIQVSIGATQVTTTVISAGRKS